MTYDMVFEAMYMDTESSVRMYKLKPKFGNLILKDTNKCDQPKFNLI